jgi:hypothetical protein
LRRRTKTCSNSTRTSSTRFGEYTPSHIYLTISNTPSATEKSLLEISELQSTLANNLSIQSAHIDQLVQDSFSTTENVGSGNRELQRATERKSTARLVFWSTCMLCTFLVGWDLVF